MLTLLNDVLSLRGKYRSFADDLLSARRKSLMTCFCCATEIAHMPTMYPRCVAEIAHFPTMYCHCAAEIAHVPATCFRCVADIAHFPQCILFARKKSLISFHIYFIYTFYVLLFYVRKRIALQQVDLLWALREKNDCNIIIYNIIILYNRVCVHLIFRR